MKHRFRVSQYSSFYAVHDTVSGDEHSMGDGVDTLFTRNHKAMRPGSEYFRRTWERALNETEDETLEAYFPEQFEKENYQATPDYLKPLLEKGE